MGEARRILKGSFTEPSAPASSSSTSLNAGNLEKLVTQLLERVTTLEEQLQGEMRERYRLELVVKRLGEGIDTTHTHTHAPIC